MRTDFIALLLLINTTNVNQYADINAFFCCCRKYRGENMAYVSVVRM